MSDRPRIGLDNPAFRGRLRKPDSARSYNFQPPIQRAPLRSVPRQTAETLPARMVAQTGPVPPAAPMPVTHPPAHKHPAKKSKRYSKQQLALVTMAGIIFCFGLAVSLQTLKTNHAAASQTTALAKQQPDGDDPSTTKPTDAEVRSYSVAPDLARYIRIPKLDINARVLQVGVKSNGQLQAPNNVHDAAWYTGSAKPGQPGATLIDGHVSSWTARGVFYNLKQLTAGDRIQIQRGDGQVVNYKVVSTHIYEADNVDMQAAMQPITPNKSGLNLISCTGKVKPGTNDFTHRLVVFAEQI